MIIRKKKNKCPPCRIWSNFRDVLGLIFFSVMSSRLCQNLDFFRYAKSAWLTGNKTLSLFHLVRLSNILFDTYL